MLQMHRVWIDRWTGPWRCSAAMGLGSWLLQPLLLLTCVQPGTGVERIGYMPRLWGASLAGVRTQSTFTLEQPLGQFNHTRISDLDAIWLVVALSNATQSFADPQRIEDSPVPAGFPHRSGFYLTLRASRAHYLDNRPSTQLRVLRVGNDTGCAPEKLSCNTPLPGPGPYRVKFLVMNDSGPVADTEWSNDIHLLQAEAFQAAPGSRSEGTVVIIAILSILLAILLAALLVLLTHTCCRGEAASGPAEQVRIRSYSPHHARSPAAMEGS
ncbi:uroplakin-3b-like protein 1 [Perognathus longimembris pacificus]|uniref:uroplakin-3b-like protein 1 n=1 Tax=Perognathus longimembris pacificus TaxID=214514 RepID=UPI0020197954|nr:uroplakin-3b-like protein 1 [Perognathus longimembris pacificus]